ncbi:MAG TPA: DUF1345 domain-containing protein [Phycicoccus sp.]|nr:DUF1345 domain-containing protein [Phycicoccus sp.]HQH07484.1 DUF1345 domain-containing protein [Phycicoccus sp.]HQK30407.1 DUF1345 domain-containing protein [Phycicoccus sp.]
MSSFSSRPPNVAPHKVAPHRNVQRLIREAIAAVAGAAAALAVASLSDRGAPTAFLVGVVVFAVFFVAPYLWFMMRASAEQTEELVEGLSPGRTTGDVIILAGAAAGLFGVVWMLTSTSKGADAKAVEGLLALAAVGSGWLLIHVMYAMRYARHWFNAETGCVDFNNTDNPADYHPAYSDFLYLAFAVGMSFAISDTNLRTVRVRRIAIGHTVLSYLFGTIVVAATINLIAGLAG